MDPQLQNWFKIEQLLTRSCVVLRKMFKDRWFLFTGKQWMDTTTDGSTYVVGIGEKIYQNCGNIQKIMLKTGDTNQWDLTTLFVVLRETKSPRSLKNVKKQKIDKENNDLLIVKKIRNNNAHHASKCIPDQEFEAIWLELSSILISFGDDKDDIDELKLNTTETKQKKSVSTANTEEAKRLKELGNAAFKQKTFEEAIKLFSQALCLPDLDDTDKSILYSNRAAAYLEKHENLEITSSSDSRFLALQDAERARELRPTWSKAHCRVGQAHVALGEYEKAVHSYNKALALDPTNMEMKEARDSALERQHYYDRQDHLIMQNVPRTTREQFNLLSERTGMSIREQEELFDHIRKNDPGKDAVFTAHQYRDGDDNVKQNYELAARFYSKAVALGNAEGMYNLALLHQQGLGVKRDMKVAIQLLEQAAAQNPVMSDKIPIPTVGVAEAEHSLGLHYETGVGVEMNYIKAAGWYERAVKHGNANAANNLGLMYGDGKGVTCDLTRSEQLLRLSATRGDPNAPMNLARLLFRKKDFQGAEQWCQYASESSHLPDKDLIKEIKDAAEQQRQVFKEAEVEQWEKQNGLSTSNLSYYERIQRKMRTNHPSSAKMFDLVDYMTNNLHLINRTHQPYGAKSRVYDPTMLKEYANKGYVFAQRLLEAQTHFFKSLMILLDNVLIDDEKNAAFLQELSASVRQEHIVIQFPEHLHHEAKQIVDRVLSRCNSKQSQLDENARVCFGYLHMNSLQPTIEFLTNCIRLYPKSLFFLELRGSLFGFLNKYENGLADFNAGLQLAPDDINFLYNRAAMLSLVPHADPNAAIAAYDRFLSKAPPDHRKVPEAYYAAASCYLILTKLANHADLASQYYNKGLEAEKHQLPCFLPCESNNKSMVSMFLSLRPGNDNITSAKTLVKSGKSTARLSDPRRIDMLQAQRKSIAAQRQLPANMNLIHSTRKPRTFQKSPASLIGLKAIALREMNPMKDHVYEGCVLSGMIFEQSPVVKPSLWLLFEDDNGDLERLFIYNIPEDEGLHLIKHTYTPGTKISILNPYMRMTADGKSAVRVDEPASIILHGESHNVKNMCRFCGEANASHVCVKCRAAHYCSKECQTIDWKQCGHKLICG